MKKSGQRSFIDKCIKDDDGKVVLAQRPNLPIIVWIVAELATFVLSDGPLKFVRAVAFGALFTWAWLEIFQGVNYFRRGFGAVVMIMLLVNAA